MKTILVTGGAGFLGSHVAEHLLRAGHRVAIIDSLEGGTEDNVPVGAHFMRMDICDEAAINRLFGHIKFDAIVHCAAWASENLSHWCRLHAYRSIVQGSATLVNAAVNQGTELFVEMSSIAVYGGQATPFKESTRLCPQDPYGAAKLAAEYDLQAAQHQFGLNGIVFRPHNLIGRRQSLADTTRNVASIFIRQALSGQALTVYGDGSQTRSWSPVSSVARVIAASVDRPETWNKSYNIGGEKVITVLELAAMVSNICGVSLNIELLPERKEAKHAFSDHGRLKDFFPGLAYEDETIESCLCDMVDEAKKRPLPPLKPTPRIEIRKNSP